MAQIGTNGVLALLSDSTNAEKPGFTPSEKNVGIVLEDIFRKASQRVVVATFASNVHRIQQVINAAEVTGRKVAVIGRSMVNVVGIASELGYLEIPDGMIIEPEEVGKMAADRVVILCTGSQGEPMSALTRMARSTHRKVDILPGDTVIIAATPVPGNEKYVGRTIDELFRLGANVHYSGANSGVHVSGHGSQEELKLMLNLMKPKYFLPIHGEFRMQRRHAVLAESVGIDPDNIFITDIGEVVEIQGGAARKAGKVTAGNVLIDGLGVGDVGNIVLRDRKLLSQDGILVVVVTLSKQDGKIVSGGDVEAGLAIAEMIASLSKPTVTVVIGGGHSIGVPIAVASTYSLIAGSATMTIHPIRMNGLVIGVPQTFEYMEKMQERVVRFVTSHSNISEEMFKELMFKTGELNRDIGTAVGSADAVKYGLMDAVGGIGQAIAQLNQLIGDKRQTLQAGGYTQ
ncbi:hypothetical protein G195_000657 [Phytophthora kernoviae 00238/432]|uniref:Zn-dependent metallo-hydrolase RNA specificity domain-containing protein n=1 Tax=Phytophthora kernoviae 00238/432 TaxID=1284355 RepID=A0A8J4SW36_9STRA|nr:hypothetical protein G195_000657 [Phytophthora kernoviae 00238/432]